MGKGYIYLASPYTSDSTLVRETRFIQNIHAVAHIINDMKVHVFSPVVHCHPIGLRYKLPQEWEFWSQYDETMILNADELWVLCLAGYTKSMGVQTELKIAKKLGKQVRYLIPHEFGYTMTEDCPKEENLYGSVLPGRLTTEKVGEI